MLWLPLVFALSALFPSPVLKVPEVLVDPNALTPTAVLLVTLASPFPTLIPLIVESDVIVIDEAPVIVELTARLPVILTFPFTSNVSLGVVLLIPTLLPLSNNEPVVNVVAPLNFVT